MALRRTRRPAGASQPAGPAEARILAAMAEAVVVSDASGRVVYANPRWYELSGYPERAVLGQRLDLPDDELVRPDGTRVPVLATRAAIPGPDGAPRWWVSTYQDFTEGRKLTNAAAFKNDLMALVSHEMSQPLSSSASLAELLADSWEQLPEETRFDLTVKIHRNTGRLVAMVTDMQLLFHLESGTVSARRTPVPVLEVVEQAAGGAELAIRIDPDLMALVDRGHLEQILSQLIGNAVAYGRPPVEVAAGRDADGVLVTVADQGAGIPEELRPYLFQRAVRPKATGAGRGRGLGLFIARHLAEVNGGRIWYEPAQPHGARLLLRLEPATPE